MKTAVETKDLVKDFKGFKAVNKLNLNVPEGAIYGFLGPNGAGKTTTLKMLTGMTEPTSGSIEIFGKPVSFGSNLNRNDIGFLPDVPGFYDWMTAKEFLEFAGSLYNIDSVILNGRIKTLLSEVGLEKSNKKIGEYSRGMKQRLGIAQALINDPKIIFLDEPVSALDPIGRKEVMDIIGKFKGRVTVFFSTHILEDVERICDRVVIIKDGKALLEDSIDNIKLINNDRKIELETDINDSINLADKLKSIKWIDKINVDNKHIIISVNELSKARLEITKYLAENKILFKKFNVIEPTLEDIFIKAVNQNA